MGRSSLRLSSAGARAVLAGVIAVVLLPGAASAQDVPEPEPELPAPPVALVAPEIRGQAYKGSVLSCTAGGWEGAPLAHEWLWFRDGLDLGRGDSRHRVSGQDVGRTLVCAVRASNNYGWTLAESAPVVVSRISVAFRVTTGLRQHGPTLRVAGQVMGRGPPATGEVELMLEGESIGSDPTGRHGAFSLEGPVWRLVPGRTSIELRFRPDDPELHAEARTTLRLTLRSPPTYPFPRSPLERAVTLFDDLPPFWQGVDGCASGCRPRGARRGWPLEPFHEQHGLRAGINERRDSGFHLGLDIQAHAWAPVYAIQPGRAHVIQRYGSNARVQIGSYVYWHLKLRVAEGEWIAAFRKPIGTVFRLHRHLHLSELDASGRYLNPLRPGGRVLAPWDDREPPVVGAPSVEPDGSLVVAAFDPQSFEERTSYVTPVLAPAALAWRLFDPEGRPLGPLRWALRGTHVLSPELVPSIFTPAARRPGYPCFAFELVCVPRWQYRLAWPGELAAAASGRRARLTVYAWDWRGNTTARDLWLGQRARAVPYR